MLVIHENGITSVTHEDLLYGDGTIVMTPWASVKGRVIVDGVPQAGQPVRLHPRTLAWSWSAGGPRLQTRFETLTDADGRFEFPFVPPLPGILVTSDQVNGTRKVRYNCQPGVATETDSGEGHTLQAVLASPESSSGSSKFTVTLAHQVTPIPWPSDVQSRASRRDWYDQWMQTPDGQSFDAERNMEINLFYSMAVGADGQIRLSGITPGNWVLRVRDAETRKELAALPVEIDSTSDPLIDLGQLVIAAAGRSQNNSATADPPAEPDKPDLPQLRVRTVDRSGEPVSQASVVVYDPVNRFRPEFWITLQTNDQGWTDLQQLPQDYVGIKVFGRKGAYDTSYIVVSDADGTIRQTSPKRSFADVSHRNNQLDVVFTMRKGRPLKLETQDSVTQQPVHYTWLYYRDDKADRWWCFALRDGAGLHPFMPLIPELAESQLRAAADGYLPVDFRLNGPLDAEETHEQTIVMTPAPGLFLTVLQPDGRPAATAEFLGHVPTGLAGTRFFRKTTDDQGQCWLPFPRQGALTKLQVLHPTGQTAVSLEQLPAPVDIDVDGETRTVFPLTVHLQQPAPDSSVAP